MICFAVLNKYLDGRFCEFFHGSRFLGLLSYCKHKAAVYILLFVPKPIYFG